MLLDVLRDLALVHRGPFEILLAGRHFGLRVGQLLQRPIVCRGRRIELRIGSAQRQQHVLQRGFLLGDFPIQLLQFLLQTPEFAFAGDERRFAADEADVESAVRLQASPCSVMNRQPRPTVPARRIAASKV